jgi:outer membrane lipoprotein
MLERASLVAIMFLVALGCASTDKEDGVGDTSHISFPQVKAAPDSFRGQSVVFGGEVLTARRMKDGTRIEILQLPLDRSGSPGYDLTQSQGRFVAIHKEFLDPATIPHGTRVTVTGEVTGTITLPLDETEYTYPVVDAKSLQVWPNTNLYAPGVPPYFGPSPYWGPYWNPYWRPWPYW